MSGQTQDEWRGLNPGKLIGSMSRWNPSSFEVFFSAIWIVWGIWFLLRPLDVLHLKMLSHASTIVWGILLAGIGSLRIASIALRATGIRKILAFATTVLWGVITVMMPTHGWMIVSMAGHALLTIASAWIYFRLNH